MWFNIQYNYWVIFGLNLIVKEAQRYSYERSYHPVVRLEDGTIWNY